MTVNFTGAASATSFTVRAFLGPTPPGTGPQVTAAASPAVVTGLTNGSLYTFTVTATSRSARAPRLRGQQPPRP